MKRLKFIYTVFLVAVIVSSGFSQSTDLPAFPGAEGHAKFTTGGRGGRIIYVTHLEDNDTAGSLRNAINQSGARIVVFKVSGTIQLKSNLNISTPNITIAGQTAPGDGICLRDYPVSVNADNVIIRFLRFRMGDEAKQEGDAIGGRFHKNIIVDHCSMSWSTDETVSFYMNENFTLQWCIISESLRESVHDKGAHGYGGIWGGKNASFHHNLLASHDSRNPRLGESAGDVFALTDAVDLRNNVIYNWQGNSCYGGEAMNVNIVNCYYRPGPATTKIERIIAIDKLLDAGSATSNIWGKFYIDGNVLEASERATNDNWTYGVYNQYHSKYGTVSAAEKAAMKVTVPHATGQVTTHSAEDAFARVLDYAGASNVRDTVDGRIIHDVRTKTATFMVGGNGSVNGIIDTQSVVGGWPELKSAVAPIDTDSDGMPDSWEDAKGLNKNSSSDAQLKTVDGKYPNVEVYINSLVSGIIEKQNEGGVATSASILKEEDKKIGLFYNQMSEELNVSYPETLKNVQVFAITGSVVRSVNLNSQRLKLNLTGVPKGIYVVRVQDVKNKIHSEKLIKY